MRSFLVTLAITAAVVTAQCNDGSAPTCPDGSAPDRSQTPPCTGGPPTCADGTALSGGPTTGTTTGTTGGTCAGTSGGVAANVAFSVSGSDRGMTTNGCPTHTWRAINPNSPSTQTFLGQTSGTVTVPVVPSLVSSSGFVNVSCVGGPVGFSTTGVAIYSPFPGTCGQDAVILEGDTFDECGGHADQSGRYHYHHYA